MVELEIKVQIDSSEIIDKDEEQIEKELHKLIAIKLSDQIEQHIESMAYMEIEPNLENGTFEVETKLVLCSLQDIETNMQIMSQKLKEIGCNQDFIYDFLSTMTKQNKGF